MNKYSIRIIILDSYMSAPIQGLDMLYSEFRGSAINQVPVLRLFGSTETGQKMCLHIHGVFPYFYIPYDGTGDVNSLMYQIATNLDKAINISLNQASSNTQHVYKICLVSGVPMYGFHSRKHQFLKIYLYNPLLIRRVSDLLMNESTLGKLYQPHETHVPFTLQFMIDYNLHGMSNLLLSKMKFRMNPDETNPNISPDLVLPPVIKKTSVCEIEGDAFAEHILNRLEVAGGTIGVNPGIAALWADEMQRRRNKGETSQIEHLLELGNINVAPTKSHLLFKQALLERLAVISTDKEVMKENINVSVYPAETPENLNMHNASLIDSQTSESSLNDTLLASTNITDTAISGQSINLSDTMDDNAQMLLKILQNLEANANEDVEEDSILSQVGKENEEDKDLDLSLPLETVMTPKKIISNKEESDDDDDVWNTTLIPQLDGECDDENESYHEQLIINNVCNKRVTRSCTKLFKDISEKNKIIREQKFIQKALYISLIRIDRVVKKGRDMPLLCDDFDLVDHANSSLSNDNNIKSEDDSKYKNYNFIFNPMKYANLPFTNDNVKHENISENKDYNFIENKVKEEKPDIVKKTRIFKPRRTKKSKKITAKRTAAELKSWQFQVKRTKKRNRLIRIMKMLHKKEHKICVLLSKDCGPFFRVIPGIRRRTILDENKKIDIISDIMLTTRNHIDPDLHLTLQYPSKQTFLYTYNGNMYPEITKIPKKVTKARNKKCLKNFINKKIKIKIDTDYNNNQSNFKQEEKINGHNAEEENELKKSIEFLRNNNATFSNSLDNILQLKNDNSCDDNNCREDQTLNRLYFPHEIIDADNDRHVYIFSAKYLTKVNGDNLISSIKDQSINQVIATLNHIKIELARHVTHLQKPIHAKIECNDNTIQENLSDILLGNNTAPENVLRNKKELKGAVLDESINKNTKFTEYEDVGNLRRSSSVNCRKSYVSLNCGAGDERKNNNIQLVQPTEADLKKKAASNCTEPLKINRNKYNLKLKKYVFLDGARDSSSSSEDESSTLKYKRTLKRGSSTNFSQLPVTISKFSSSKSQDCSSDKHLVSQNTKNFKENETSINRTNTQETVCGMVKRRLNFDNTLQTTVIEEKLVCNYSPFNSQEKVTLELAESSVTDQHTDLTPNIDKCINSDLDINISSISNNKSLFNVTTKDHTQTDTCENENNLTKPTFSQTENSTSNFEDESDNENTLVNMESNSDSDIFSTSDSGDEAEKSFFKSPQIANELKSLLTTAQKYDREAKYNAKEGSSKVLTPQLDSQKSLEESHHSSESSGLLTLCQQFPEDTGLRTSKQNSTEKPLFKNNRKNDMFSSQVLIPIKKAPTKDQVIKSLDEYKIPSSKVEVPFYSNIEDVTGSVEVGSNVLKITSNTSAHLSEFESQIDSINNYRKCKMEKISSNLDWKKSNVNNLLLSFCKDRICIISPVKRPPSKAMVKNWIGVKSKRVVTPEKKSEKVKIFIPLSPGGNNDDDDDMNMSLTISPCTPINSESRSTQTASSNPNETPKSSMSKGGSSPILGHECRKRKKKLRQKLSQTVTPTLRTSLLISQDKSNSNNSCQITGVSPNNTYAFDHSTENLQAARAVIEHQLLTSLVLELHIRTRGEYKPDPQYDSIRAIFYSVLSDVPTNQATPSKCEGVIAINSVPLSPNVYKVPILDGAGINCDVTYVDSEENLLNEFLKLVSYWNPDILAGYEIQMLSWGYLIDRASVLGMNLKSLLSRTREDKKYRDDGQSELQITGRIILDVWRLMRHEIALQSYTFESVIYHILHKRVAQYSFKDLSFWWDHRSSLYRHRTVHYYLYRVHTILELFDKLDIIGRTSELARLFGIQFFEVLSRGSQFRVESMMLRLAKPLNFVPVSPSVQQRALMKAPEYIPLILEPESKLYNDPVIVLDFQSLYPSIIIAYNYCFTTCLGRVSCLGKNAPFEFGASQLKISRKQLEKFLRKDLINFSPCSVGFVKKTVRDGILPRMLREILDTRLMVKNSMKENRDDNLLQKVLHNRQLGLKLIANVTYGYTAANFSGRMASVEVADSVVSKGRETLQRAIEMVDNTPEWGARVVYGDTDSLFVLVPGKTRQYAFEVGKKIADAITKANPDPIKLKLEKVYQPCILQTKKRYVGYMYENPDQKDPVYDAKGIETVRRDGCPAVSKMLEKCLRLLFETKDVSLIKKYVLRQFNKIIAGRASIQDLTFAKEYRGASGYRPGACVPSLELARKWKSVDNRNEPRRGERVPYIIINGPPGLPLIRLVRSPRDLLNDSSLRPNALYYITKVIIPPINRCFNLIGADLHTWFNQMPRKQIQTIPNSISPGKKSTISQYFSTTSCVACGEQTQTGICDVCTSKPQITGISLMEKLRHWERNNYNCNLICQSCTGIQTEIKCVSLDCPVLYKRIQTNRDVQQTTYIRELISSNEFLF